MRRLLISAGSLLIAAVLALGGVGVANAAGSDATTPYTVTTTGVTLPAGQTFEAHGHVNWRTTAGNHGVHFDPNNGHPGGVWIGQSTFVFSPALAPGECVTWVQVAGFNEHFGEGGQAPLCVPEEEPEEPEFVPDFRAAVSAKAQCSANEGDLSVQGYARNNGAQTLAIEAFVDGVSAGAKVVEPGKAASWYVRGVRPEGGTVSYLLTATNGATKTLTSSYAANTCGARITAEPSVVDVCGVDRDEVVLPQGRNITFATTSVVTLEDGTIRHRIVGTPAPGYTLPAEGSWDRVVGGKAVWLLYTTDAECPVVEPPVDPEPPVEPPVTEPPVDEPTEEQPPAAAPARVLAETGSEGVPWALGAAGLLLVGFALTATAAMRRRTAE